MAEIIERFPKQDQPIASAHEVAARLRAIADEIESGDVFDVTMDFSTFLNDVTAKGDDSRKWAKSGHYVLVATWSERKVK